MCGRKSKLLLWNWLTSLWVIGVLSLLVWMSSLGQLTGENAIQFVVAYSAFALVIGGVGLATVVRELKVIVPINLDQPASILVVLLGVMLVIAAVLIALLVANEYMWLMATSS